MKATPSLAFMWSTNKAYFPFVGIKDGLTFSSSNNDWYNYTHCNACNAPLQVNIKRLETFISA